MFSRSKRFGMNPYAAFCTVIARFVITVYMPDVTLNS